jgi:hypothetical protein
VSSLLFWSLIYVDIAALLVALVVWRRTANVGAQAHGVKKAIRIIGNLGGVGLILTPGFLVAGAMGLAAEGPKGPFFFITQAFYISTMGYPLMYLACTGASVLLANRNRVVLALLAEAAPITIPVLLFALARVTA